MQKERVMKLQQERIELSNGSVFRICHNLAYFGLNLDNALQSWLYRTDTYTEQSFCDYIKSKDCLIIANPI